MEAYEGLKAAHVLGAAVWVGGAIILQVLDWRASRSGPEGVEAQLRDAEFIGTRVFIPASLVVLAAGIGLLVQGSWVLQPWIVFGLAVWALSFLTGALFLAPEATRIFATIAAEGPASSTVQGRLRRLHMVSRVEDYLLVLVLLDMVVKPGV